ncbi:MAG: NifU family protein [Holosporaceae bacterium]|jgi:Fe-S cluster biogenesis protein NfuA|nr:NifU family protein [Holosporaceae bacterium]
MNLDSSLMQKITETVDQYIRPSLGADGGDVEIISLEKNTLFVKLKGACCGCPCAGDTIKYGIQRTLNQMVSEDLVVVPV